MARLWQDGFEFNSAASGGIGWSSTSGSPTVSSTTFRSGIYAGRISSLVSATAQRFIYQFSSANANGPYFFRTYLNVATLPSAANRIIIFQDSGLGTRVYITINSTGTLTLFDEDGQIGSSSSALSTNTWYRVELQIDLTGAGGAHIVNAKIDGTQFAGSSTRNISTGIFRFAVGGNLVAEAQTQGDWFFDDVALNDSNGSFQNSYPDSGAIIHLHPNASGDANALLVQVGGTAGSANNFTRVKEVTPDDVTTYNASAVLNAEDLLNVDNSGLSSSDTINVVAVGIRATNLVSADATTAVKVEIMKTTGGTKAQSADIVPNSTSWQQNAAAIPRNYPLVTYQDPDSANWTNTTLDSMQIGYIIDVVGTQSIAITTVWASVDYTVAAPTTTSSSSSTSSTSSSTSTSTSSTSSSTSSTSSSSSTSSTSSSTSSTSSSTSSTSSSSSTSSTSSSTSSTSSSSSSSTSSSTSSTSLSTSSTSTTLPLGYSKNPNLYMKISDEFSVMIGAPKFPTWPTSSRPTGILGLYGGNIDTGKIEWYNGTSWLNADGSGV